MKAFRLFAAAVVVAVSGAAARADLITQTLPFGPQIPNFDQTLTFQQFHGNLADLVSVHVQLDMSISGGLLVVDNDAPLPAHVHVELGAHGDLSSVDVALLDIAFQPVTGTVNLSTGETFDLAPNEGDVPNDFDPAPPDGATHVGGLDSDSGAGFINPIFFPGYVGAGTFDILAVATQLLDYGGVSGVELAYVPVTAEGSVTVSYNFVPEPASACLLGMALLGVRKRRTHNC